MKPMLAAKADLTKLKFPLLASPKLDGIRAIVKDGKLLSRTLKPIRNMFCQKLFSHLEGFDGELIVGLPTAKDVFQKSTSGVMSKDGTPDVKYYVFDNWNREGGYLLNATSILDNPFVVFVESKTVNSLEELELVYEEFLEQGYEGVMLRDPEAPYKFGRSTVKSQNLLKHKPFEDSEFKVVGFTQKMHNANEATTNELGNTERSSCKDGLVPTGVLGALVLEYGEDFFECGTGFTDEQRKEIYENQDKYLGKLAKIQHQVIGQKNKPRFPSFINFLGFRDEEDL
jgi:DNA ligase-1